MFVVLYPILDQPHSIFLTVLLKENWQQLKANISPLPFFPPSKYLECLRGMSYTWLSSWPFRALSVRFSLKKYFLITELSLLSFIVVYIWTNFTKCIALHWWPLNHQKLLNTNIAIGFRGEMTQPHCSWLCFGNTIPCSIDFCMQSPNKSQSRSEKMSLDELKKSKMRNKGPMQSFPLTLKSCVHRGTAR